jgi:hypothetical protein
MDPWRYSTAGISVALRVTPRGGRDDIDGVETLANGRSVVKVRVRAIADGGEANRAVTELIAKGARRPQGQGADSVRHHLSPQANCRRRRRRQTRRGVTRADRGKEGLR